MKTNKDFRLSKSSKRILALMDGDKRSHWKKMMISAELSEKNAKFAKIRERNSSDLGE
jgi:hypothetical protein